METLEDERYVVIKAYKCTVSEIWRDSFVLASIYCVYVVSLHTESTDSVIASYPVPRPAFRRSDEKLGVGLGTRLLKIYSQR